MGIVLVRRRWYWIGHVLRIEPLTSPKLLSDGHQRVKGRHLEEDCGSRPSGPKPLLGASCKAYQGPTEIEESC